MPWTLKGKKRWINCMFGKTPASGAPVWLSLHTGLPDANGSNEATGGSPAYARIQATWHVAQDAANNVDAYINQIAASSAFDVPAGTYFFVGLWDAASGGDFLGWFPLSGGDMDASVVWTAAATNGGVAGSTIAVNDRVILAPVLGSALPSGFNATTIYFATTNTTATELYLATTQGGTAINSAQTGSAYAQKVTPVVFAAQDKYVVNALQIKMEN